MRKKYLIIFDFLFFLFILTEWWFFSANFIQLNSQVTTTDGIFTLESEIPEARTESGGITLNNDLYVLGGLSYRGKTLKSVYRYSTLDSSWVKVKDLPEPINHVGVVQDGQFIYAVGGFEPLTLRIRGFMFANWKPLNTFYKYDPKKNEWFKLASMPEARGAGGVCISNDTIWYIGGINKNKVISNSLFGYCIKSKKWFKSVPMNYARDHLRAEAVNGKVYAISGRKDDLRFNLPYMEEFNTKTKTWKQMADIPTPRGGFGSSVYNGKIYTYGGEDVWSCFEVFEVFNPITNKWSKQEPLPEARHGIISGWIGNQLHLVSGGRHPRLSVSGIHRVYKGNK